MLTPDDSALQAVRRRHELRVLESLATHGNRTRRELETDTKLSRTTLSAIVSDLRLRGVVNESEPEIQGRGRSGRPTKVLSLNPNAGAAVGIELGRRRISISVTGFDGSTVVRELCAISSSVSLPDKVAMAADMIKRLIADGRINTETVIGTAVGIASRHANPNSLADGVEQQSDPQGASLTPLREVIPGPMLWDNNIRLAAMAYGKGSDDLLYVVLSAGISSAIVSQGSLMRGGNGIAGELGHISVDFAGPVCWCGRHGCLESFINEANVLVEAAHRGQSFQSIEAMAQAAAEGNGIAINVVSWAGELLARALMGACVLLDPRRVVITGELSQFGELLLEPARRALAEQNLDLGPRSTEISAATFAPSAGSDGASQMALKHWSMATVG
ncbi:ROK family transcriptional regulator [Arthrobacter sp. BF1]|uniref:ROK family transcriptional regulator n=1 Tax=Arthrobacter sp. BF1 TaxID=2821145 RepID=UPI001C4E3A7A|nr:ROK family transcriptional regulator [Arthrobacter sp. BF1]